MDIKDFKPDVIFTKPGMFKGPAENPDDIITPKTLDFRDLVLKTEDQGKTPQCAAYTGTSWIESIEWRRTGKPIDYPPAELYKVAKTLDGHPDEDGTTLPAIMQGMIQLGWTNKKEEDIRVIYTIPELKRAIHRYNTILIACDIHAQWGIQSGIDMKKLIGNSMGGHAIICCGFDRKGVFIQNSWGLLWGYIGYCRIAWDVFEKEFKEASYYANALDSLEK